MYLKIIGLFLINFLFISCSVSDGSSQNNDSIIVDNEIKETCISFGQNTSRCSFIHDGLERFYLIYKPQSLDEEDASSSSSDWGL